MKIALVGCGAVSQTFYVPALKSIPEHSVEWFVDPNIERARQAAKAFGQGNVTRDYKDTIRKVDAAIVAVPNFLHSRISIDFLDMGRDVLCEKPLAINVNQGLAMVKAGESSGARLVVNLIRRRFENYHVGRSVLNRGIIGDVGSVNIEEGDLLAWRLASLFMLEKEKAGGGVLIDLGSHVLDILHWLFSCHLAVSSYKDDGLGRVESDCEAELIIEKRGKEIPCNVKLSRIRKLRNSLIIQGDKGSLEIRPYDLNRVYLSVSDSVGEIHPLRPDREKPQVEHFADQIRQFMDASSGDIADGNEALQSLKVIEECYRNRQELSHRWEKRCKSSTGVSINPRYGKILVVGASGFVGTRLVERLALDLKVDVRVAVHRPETAARLGRLPVEYVECDLLDPGQVMRCVEGCDVVVNCARDRSGDRILDVSVNGTENLLEASARHGIRKYVHLSSAAVHGFRHGTGVVDESARLKLTINPYIRGKIKSEKLVMSYAHRFPVVILRPTLIYGPFSADWVVGIIERLKNQLVTQVGNSKLANLIFIDDVVDAILLAIEREEANGGIFIINDDKSRISWTDYIKELSEIVGISPRTMPDGDLFSYNARKLASLVNDSVVATRRVLESDEMLALLARIPIAVLLGGRLMKAKRRAEVGSRLSSGLTLKYESKSLQKYQGIGRDFYEVLACSTVFSASKAEATFGFRTGTSFGEGMEKTREWVKWARLVQ